MKERVVQMKRHLHELLKEQDYLKQCANRLANELQLCADFQEESIELELESVQRQIARIENEIDNIILALSLGIM